MSAAPFEIAGAHGRIRIGYRTPGIKRELDARGRAALARELGMGVIEPQFHPERDIAPQDARALREAADAEGVAIPSLGCELPLTDPADARLMDLVDEVLSAVETLGAGSALCAVKLPPADVPQEETWRLLAERAHAVCERFARAGRRFGFEPDHGTFIHTAERLRRLVTLADHPAACANFDACNLYLGGSDPVEAATSLAPRIISGHIKDGVFRTERRGETAIGEGEVPWAAILRAMLQARTDATMYFEHFGAVANLRAAAARFRPILERVARETAEPPATAAAHAQAARVGGPG